jgi:hypothetical protein
MANGGTGDRCCALGQGCEGDTKGWHSPRRFVWCGRAAGRLSARARTAAVVVGDLVIFVFAIVILLR